MSSDVFDLLAQVWLSASRRTLTHCIAIVSLGMGVAAFVCLSALSQSFSDSLKHRVGSAEPGSEFTLEAGPTISMEVGSTRAKLDAEWVNAQVRRVAASQVAAMTRARCDVKIGRYALREMTVFAVSSEWLQLQPHFWGIHSKIAGRLFSPADDKSGEAVCIIDQRLVHALPDNADPVGQTLKVNGRPFRVVGIVRGDEWLRPGGSDGLLLTSLSATYPLLRIQPPEGASFLITSDEARVESDMASLRTAVSQALGGDYSVSVRSPWLDLAETRYQLGYMRLFLGALSLLPLVVGLLGMVSMLLANLGSRVREIGLHRALGATRSRQAVLVLSEAGVTGLLSCLVGIPVATLVLRLLASAWGSELRMTPGCIAAAVLASAITAVLAGLIPARAAMGISPCEALRAE